MKIQCDVCNKEEALVFCSADEAALCNGCDQKIHHANKLASKHHRFSLLNPTNKDAPCCDVCQERRAFLFCRDDRAILCRECDVSIHAANEHTKKHIRFLLTGVKLASCNITASSNPSSVDSMIKTNSQMLTKKDTVVAVLTPPPSIESTTSTASKGCGGGYIAQSTTSGGGSTSSIAEYLIETLPGWHVEDFLDSSSAPPHGFCKNDDLLLFLHADFETNLANLPSDDVGMWVPQAPPATHQFHSITEQKNEFFKEVKDVNKPSLVTKTNKRWSDHGFTVPQISPPSNKRCRSFW